MASETLEDTNLEEGALPEKEDTEMEETMQGIKKRGRRGKGESKKKEVVERPVRDRKTVVRYSASSSERGSGTKKLSIPKGPGTQLKDIPNVAFKLSKRKPDENLQSLHAIIFGKRAKAYNLKKDISQFSGFVWVDNKDKQRGKLKDKLDKCVKEKLFDFCDVLDIPVHKSAVKKEELSAKLLEFLESPHATTEDLLAEKEQSKKGKKRKRKVSLSTETSGESSAKRSTKKRKQSPEAEKKGKHLLKDEEKVKVGSSDNKNDYGKNSSQDMVNKEETDGGSGESEEVGKIEEVKETVKARTKNKKVSAKKSIKEDHTAKARGKKRATAKSSSSPVKPMEIDEETRQSEELGKATEVRDKPKAQTKKKQDSDKKNIKRDPATKTIAKKRTPAKSGSSPAKPTESDEGPGESEKDEDKMKEQMEGKKVSVQKSIKKGSTKKPIVEKSTPAKSGKHSAKSTESTSRPALRKAASASPSKAKGAASEKGTSRPALRKAASASPSKAKGAASEKAGKSEKKIQMSSGKKSESKSAGEKLSVEQQGKRKSMSKPKAEPSSEEMHAAVRDILKEVDFNTATLSDIVRQLGTIFGIDLMHRKTEMKDLIAEVIKSMSDLDDDTDGSDDADNTEEDAADDAEEAGEDAVGEDFEEAGKDAEIDVNGERALRDDAGEAGNDDSEQGGGDVEKEGKKANGDSEESDDTKA